LEKLGIVGALLNSIKNVRQNPNMRWLDNIPLITLLIPAILLGLAPFVPEPHLVEKLRMLSQGELSKPIDIFDLFMHGTPALLVAIKLVRMGVAGKTGPSDSNE
jgi:hypothetical protein